MKNSKRLLLTWLVLLSTVTGHVYAIDRPGPLVDTGWLAKHLGEVVVLDLRMEPRSFGAPLSKKDSALFAPTPLKATLGHIPGAKPFPAKLVADRLGPAIFYPADEIRAAARAMGVDPDAPAITYCNSGVLCSLTWFALHELLGNSEVKMFDGAIHPVEPGPAATGNPLSDGMTGLRALRVARHRFFPFTQRP